MYRAVLAAVFVEANVMPMMAPYLDPFVVPLDTAFPPTSEART